MIPPRSSPSVLLIAAAFVSLTLVWGTTWAAIRIGLEGLPPLTGVSLRFLIAGAFLGIFVPFLGIRLGRSKIERRLWVVNSLFSFVGSYSIVYWAEQYVPSGLTAVLFATFPLLVAGMAHFTLPGERLSPRSIFGVVLGFVGVAVIFSDDFEKLGGPKVGFAAAVLLLAPFVSAVANVAVKKWGAGIHPVSLTAVPMAMAGGLTGIAALAFERGREVRFDAASTGALLYLAIFGSAFTFTVYYWLMSHLPATRLALIAYAIPVVAVFVGAIFLAEPVTTRMIAGSSLVVIGVAAAARAKAGGR